MKIYTRRGDDGQTGLFGGGRVSKAHARVEAYGQVDELNAVLGRAVATGLHPDSESRLRVVQHDLFCWGAHLATPPAEDSRPRPALPALPQDRESEMEAWIDEATETTGPLQTFIVPGGSAEAAELHVARTVCRRVERCLVGLAESEPLPSGLLRYLNRLSDLLFQLARLENHRMGHPDVPWSKPDDD